MFTDDSDDDVSTEHRLPRTCLPETEEEILKALSTAPSSVFRLLKWQKPASMLPGATHVPKWMTPERRNQLETQGKDNH